MSATSLLRRRLRSAGLLLALPLAACGGTSAMGSSTAGTHPARITGTAASDVPGSPGSPSARPTRFASAPESDWPTFGANAARTGVGAARTGITAGNLRALRVRTVRLDGAVDSAPIELAGLHVGGRSRDLVFMTTSYGTTVALDAGTGQRLWQYRAGLGSLVGTPQVTTATPVADPDRRFVYAATPDGFIHKLVAATGREVRGGWPARMTFDPRREKLAGALNVEGSALIAVTGGYYGDAPAYQGHVVTISRATGRVLRVFNSLCSGARGVLDPPSRCSRSDSAIWAREGSVVEPGTGRILIATGNGDYNGRTDWGNAVLELSPALDLLHAWAPANTRQLSDSDIDIGSTAPALVTTGGRRLAIQGGKSGRLYLLDLDRLNGTRGPANGRLGGELGSVASPGGGEVLTSPAVYAAAGRSLVFVADDAGTAAYAVAGGAHARLALAWRNATAGTSPVIAGGLLYVYDERGGHLDVYRPASGRRLVALPVPAGHWNSPIVAGGRIILPVGTYHDHGGSGEVVILHLPGR